MTPRFLSPFRKIPYLLEKLIKSEIKILFENDFIEKSRSQFASPIVLILKKNGKIIVCYKTIQGTFPISNPEDLFVKVKGAKVFGVLDLQNGYFHIPVNDLNKKGFILPWGKY